MKAWIVSGRGSERPLMIPVPNSWSQFKSPREPNKQVTRYSYRLHCPYSRDEQVSGLSRECVYRLRQMSNPPPFRQRL